MPLGPTGKAGIVAGAICATIAMAWALVSVLLRRKAGDRFLFPRGIENSDPPEPASVQSLGREELPLANEPLFSRTRGDALENDKQAPETTSNTGEIRTEQKKRAHIEEPALAV